MEKSIAKDLLSIGAVFLRPEQPFTWASGIKSPVYCDNRLTLTVTLFGRNDALRLLAVTSGGSQAIFFKINTLGEEAFLRRFVEALEKYPGK